MTLRVKYTGGLPTGAQTIQIQSTVEPDVNITNVYPLQHTGLQRFVYDIQHDETGTVNGSWSTDGGVTWNIFYSVEHTAPAAGSTTQADVFIGIYRDVKFEWVNGGADQTVFNVNMIVSRDRGAKVAEAPAALSGGFLWMRSDNVTLGTGVADWPNLYPQHAASIFGQQTSGPLQPTWNSSDANFNGQPTVYFDAASAQYLNLEGIWNPINGDDTPFTAFLAVRPTTGGSAGYWSVGDTLNVAHNIWCDSASGNHRFRRRYGANENHAGDPVTINQTQIWTWAFTGTTITLRRDGVEDSVIDGASADTDPTAFDIAVMGARVRNSIIDRYNTMYVAEFVISNAANSQAEIDSVEAYMGDRYGVAI